MVSSNDESQALTSIKCYHLGDSNAEKFYDDWRIKTLMLADTKGCKEPLTMGKDKTIPMTDGGTDEEKKLYKANKEANNLLTMSCTGVPLGLVIRAKGNARDALMKLDQKYAKKSSSNVMALLTEYANCKLESANHDPEAWFIQLDRINMKLAQIDEKYEKKDYEIKTHLLNNLPDEYQHLVTTIVESDQEDKKTVADIEEAISRKWCRDLKEKSKVGGKNNVAMFTDAKDGATKKNNNKFKGRCRKCGKVGHKKADCRSDAKGVCFNCGKDGHYAKDCPTKKKGDGATDGTGMFVGMAV